MISDENMTENSWQRLQLYTLAHPELIVWIFHFYLSEESAYKVLNNPSPDGKSIAGIPIIIEAYNQHKDNAEVVDNVWTLFMELTEYGKPKTF